jgi:RNA polymerase sigma-70 factor (ECF subfamily)
MTFESLYRAHFRYVWQTLRRLGVRDADTLDAAQDVFLVVHRRLAEFEGRAKMTTWLFRICMHVASDRRRAAPLRREAQGLDLATHADDSADASTRAEWRQDLALAEAILDELPDEQRVVFVLFEIEEQSGDDIAEVLGVPVGTVRSRLRLAREAFRRAVDRRQAAPSMLGRSHARGGA